MDESDIAAIEFVTENLASASASKTTPLAKLVADDIYGLREQAALLHNRLAMFRAGRTVIA
ncbi:MAG: hypothetical protein JNM13_14325 [Hyphomicrobiaceae bacterium]|nr:hypothetical protein [Hyphomicrobiaceae bacterium]